MKIIAILVVLSALVTAIVIRRRRQKRKADWELGYAFQRAELFIKQHNPEE